MTGAQRSVRAPLSRAGQPKQL
ncbi:MAG: hypothetical protein K0S35_2158, partial [Geminicoccaceae bacterium]|nr:hypothetical protein [Geminicoccaceae bacterium]